MKPALSVFAGVVLGLSGVGSASPSPAAAHTSPACRAVVSIAPNALASLASAYATNPSVVATYASDAFLGTMVSGHPIIEGLSGSGRTLWVKPLSGAPGLLMATATTLAFAQFQGGDPFRMSFDNLASGRVVEGPSLKASGNVLYSYTAYPGGFLVAADVAYSNASRNTVYLDIYGDSGALRSGLAIAAPRDTAPVNFSVSGDSVFVAVPHAGGGLVVFKITADAIQRYLLSVTGGATSLAAVGPNAIVLFSIANTSDTSLAASGWSLGAKAKRVWTNSLTIAGPVIAGPGGWLYSAGGALGPSYGPSTKVYPGLIVNGLTGKVTAQLGTGSEVVIPWLATQHGVLAVEQAYGSTETTAVVLSRRSGRIKQTALASDASAADGLAHYRPLVLQSKASTEILSPLFGGKALVLPGAGCGSQGPPLGG
jgi:hypothetical protein